MTIQAQSALDADSKMTDEKGKLADSIRGGYSSAATKLQDKGRELTAVSGWLADTAGVIGGAKKHMALLVRTGTSEIRDALDSEVKGTSVSPSSRELTDKYRNDIAAVATKLTIDLDAIGHSLAGDPGASTTPTYVRAAASSTAPTVEQAAVHHGITGEGPHAEPHQLPEMPRATSAPSGTESSSSPSAPSSTTSPHIANPILSNLVAGSTSSSSTPSSTGTSSSKSPSSTTATSTPAGQQAQQPTETYQNAKSTGLLHIPSAPLPDLPAAAQTIATAVSSATAHQLPTSTAPTSPGSSTPASTGLTPGVAGTPPMTPTPPAGLAPIGGLPTPPVVQAPPAPQGTPGTASPAAPAPSSAQSPAPAPRGPVADLAWIQRNYGLSPGVELPKSETTSIPALFITDLPENESTLHRVLASIRHQFEAAGWSQPMSAATIRRGLEARTVYVTADGLSIHPSGILLPTGVLPLDEVPSVPTALDLHGSLMVTDKLRSLLPRGWTIEGLLSTVPGEEASQSAEQFQQLVESGELLVGKVSRSRDDVGADEALRVFARAAIDSAGCSELDVESARIRAARWIGTQPTGYLDVLSRYHLADAAESMSQGSWGEAVYSSEKYLSIRSTEKQVA
ncbi:hypothetical protein ACDI85_08140 [Mycobacteroides abscessus]|uniref:hypothetical protein n=1 Tax=Mycobacteroides abscessus TaxID=36809 RepID=UPI0035561177